MYNSNIFKVLFISLFMCPMFSPAMEKQNSIISKYNSNDDIFYTPESSTDEDSSSEGLNSLVANNFQQALQRQIKQVQQEVQQLQEALQVEQRKSQRLGKKLDLVITKDVKIQQSLQEKLQAKQQECLDLENELFAMIDDYDVDLQIQGQDKLLITQLKRQKELDRAVFAIAMKNVGEQIDQLNGYIVSKASINDVYQKPVKISKPKSEINDKDLPLLKAVLLNKSTEAENLLRNGSNPNIIYEGHALIHHVITKQNNLALALEFIKNGADFSECFHENKDMFTYVSSLNVVPIQGRAKQINFDLMHELVSKGYDLQSNFNNVNLVNNAWYQALKADNTNHIHFCLGQYPTYKLPVSANPNAIFKLEDGSFSTPLLTVLENYTIGVKEGNEYRRSLTIYGGSVGAINAVIKQGGANINQILDVNAQLGQHSPLSYVLVKDGGEFIIKFLIESGANIKTGFELFIQNGGSPNFVIKNRLGGYTSLLGLAIHYQNKEAIEFLIDAGVDINQIIDPYPYPINAGANQISSRTKQRSKQPEDPHHNLRGPHNPLFYALAGNNNEVIKLLLSKEAII